MSTAPVCDPPARYGEAFETIAARFERHGVLGLLLVDGGSLGEIERDHGDEARRAALDSLLGLTREVARERLDVDDLVVAGEPGQHELLVFLFREHRDARFFRQELPGFEQSLRQALERRGNKVFYPYLRKPPALVSGTAVAFRNPKFGIESQIAHAMSEARTDLDLNRKLYRRRRRRQFTELLLDRKVSSVYEPIVDVATRTVFGYEALARGPEGSEMRAPLKLFKIAEQEGMVFELDCLCRAGALDGAVDLPSGTKLFINIRPTTIHDPDFRAERLIQTLAQCQLQPSDVVFEISEQESISNMDAFLEIRDYYRALGFQIALDDTGAGYAGLEAMFRLSPEYIKVDRAFVSGVDEDEARQDLLAALQSVAAKTGARIIGEGLDTLEELETLANLGIEFGQGWLFGKPTPLRAT